MTRVSIVSTEDYSLVLEGDLVAETFNPTMALVLRGDTAALKVTLPSKVLIPTWCLQETGGRTAFSPASAQTHLQTQTEQARKRLRAQLLDALRRLESVHAVWPASGFFGLKLKAQGEAKLYLSAWLLGTPGDVVIAEFSIRVMALADDKHASYALCSVFRLSRLPQLRLDLDDYNFSFPEFEFLALNLADALKWELPNSLGMARIFERLSRSPITANIQPVNEEDGNPHLYIYPNDGQLHWAILKNNVVPGSIQWGQLSEKSPELARFNVKVQGAGSTVFSLNNAVLACHGTRMIAGGTIVPGSTLELKQLHGCLGPLCYQFDEVSVSPSITATDNDIKGLCAEVKFNRLHLWLIDDPEVFLVLKGKVQITPNGASIAELSLVEPYSIQLVAAGAQALVRGVQAVATFLAKIDAPDVDKLRGLLTILGKFAAAIARAALFVGEAVANAALEAASLVGQALSTLADAIGSILSKLAELVPDDPPVGLNIEVRVALDPIELRQILITWSAPFASKKVSGGGFDIALAGGWKPGLLMDFVDEPGAYLVAIRDTNQEALLATMGTDLWLASETEDAGKKVSHTPDADGDSGNRSEQQRLITVNATLNADDDQEPFLAVIVGLSRGKAVFLQQITSPLQSVGDHLTVVGGGFTMKPIGPRLGVGVQFEPKRLLPLLGMGEAGDAGNTPPSASFLDKLKQDLGQVVWVERFDGAQFVPGSREVKGDLVLGIKAAGISTTAKLNLLLNLDDMTTKLDSDKVFSLKSQRIEEDALGLTWIIEQKDRTQRKDNVEVEMFQLSFADGESGFGLNTEHARMELRFKGLSTDGQGVRFKVTKFFVGRRGVDIEAEVDDSPVRLNGLDVPFRFQSGSLVIRAGRLVQAAITGRGTLPPALVGEADCTIALAFAQEESGIVLQSGKVEIDKKGEPIVCHSTRFTLTLTDLDLGIQKDGGYHLYFLVTGSLRFTPKTGEFEDGLLAFLKDVEINLERTPLTGDARVLSKHISFQKTLKPKKSFPLFNLFTFELRGFGFHPSSLRFDGQPAICLSGQIQFAEIGDVAQPKIDFHGLWIAAPRPGEALPRISAEGLGVDLQLSGAVKIRGTVLAVDPGTRTVEGKALAPAGYNTYGFLGEGEVDIPGWGTLPASLGFLEVEHQDEPGDRRKAFFIYLQRDKLSIEIPTGFWTFYMREVGFGFGFRYTLAGIQEVDKVSGPARQVKVLDDVSKRQGELGRFSSWIADPEGDRFTLAMRAAIQAYPAQKQYDDKTEEVAENPFFFDLILAIRSDMTLLASLRGFLGVNYADFRANKDDFRTRPGLRGYLYISAPRSELLARMVGDSTGFIGERFPGLQKGQILRKAVESVDWTSTLYIRPGLFHYELGWPDQLAVRLVDTSNMKVSLRGGMIFRAAEDGLLWGYNIEADAWLKFGGSVGRSIGVCVEASLQARLVARLIAYLSWRFKGSMVYGLVSLDASLTFSVRAWMEVDLGFKSFTLRIGFSFSVQFSAAVELAITTEGVGGRVSARIAVRAFGCTLGVSVGFAFNDRELDSARQRVQRFMAMSITAEEPDTPPVLAAAEGDRRGDVAAEQEAAKRANPAPTSPTLKPPVVHASGRDIKGSNFWLVLYEVEPPEEESEPYAIALLVPREPIERDLGGFYAAPSEAKNPNRSARPAHTLHFDKFDILSKTKLKKPDGITDESISSARINVNTEWSKKIPVDGDVDFTLAHLFDECFLTDTEWVEVPGGAPVRHSIRWKEPQIPLIYKTEDGAESSPAPDQRMRDRDEAQKWQAAQSAGNPADDRAHQARSTVMSMFLDQFISYAKTGKRSTPKDEANVLDLGLVFYGPASELELFEAQLSVEKLDASKGQAGRVFILNPLSSWFNRQDPVFSNARSELAPNGVRLAWDLSLPWPASNGDPHDRVAQDPEQFLHYYEIVRTVEGQEFTPRTLRVKPTSTIGKRDEKEGTTQLLWPDWQFTDDLGDLGPELQRALLPTGNETDAMSAVMAWIANRLDEAVTLSYSVTPVDIAGTRGLPRSFVVTIPRPQPAVRAAEAELRIVQTLTVGEADLQWQQRGDRPQELHVYLGLGDAAWRDSDDIKPSMGGLNPPRCTRKYALVVEQEIALPAGSYGSDGLTDKIRGLGSAGAQAELASPTGGRNVFEFKLADLIKLPTDPSAEHPGSEYGRFESHVREKVEPSKETRTRLNRWTRLSRADDGTGLKSPLADRDADRLLDALWSVTRDSDPERVAARFWLRTETHIQYEVELPDKQKEIRNHVLFSKLTPVATELSIDAKTQSRFRPEVFEWPVHLRLPALPPKQVRVKTGFMHLRMPATDATLTQWVGDEAARRKAVTVTADPERRSMALVEFDAMPAWESSVVAPLHASSIAGYDLHELDLDQLAPLDTEDTDLSSDMSAWRRARRVAHIELLSEDNASLMPASNADWLGWQAHYPSETQRLDRAKEPSQGARPTRRAWYSASESTPHFAERLPRHRLMTQPLESAITDLMRFGPPQRVRVRLVAAPDSKVRDTLRQCLSDKTDQAVNDLLEKWRLTAPHLGLAASTSPTTSAFEFDPETRAFSLEGVPFCTADLRYFLLSLCWEQQDTATLQVEPDTEAAHARSRARVKALTLWQADPTAFDGLSLSMQAFVDNDSDKVHSAVTIPLDFKSSMHPLLEELVGEMALGSRQSHDQKHAPEVYRKFAVMPQPASQLHVREFSNFLASTAAATDPYGWGALQSLGLAVTVRMFDAGSGRFVKPTDLAKQANTVFAHVLRRWKSVRPDWVAGQPFAEVLLKPGKNRVVRPYDAQKTHESHDFSIDDDALAMIQLSLRPTPAQAWGYVGLEVPWPGILYESPESVEEKMLPREVTLEITRSKSEIGNAVDIVDVMVLATGSTANLASIGGSATLLLPAPSPKSTLKIFFRRSLVLDDVQTQVDGQQTTTNLSLKDLTFKFFGPDGPESIETEGEGGTRKRPIREVSGEDIATHVKRVAYPAAQQPDAFGAFSEQTAARWVDAIGAEPTGITVPSAAEPASTARRAFRSLAHHLRAAAPDLAFPKTESDLRTVMAQYLQWSQRFLDHAASTTAQEHEVSLALAAPSKATPWKLAPDQSGCLTLGIPVDDRWAHARAYAVKPLSRFAHLMAGVGVLPSQEREALVTVDPNGQATEQNIGYAVAVFPRTERIEPPVILGSSVRDGAWEIVLARHGEESLAHSNCPLFARLGKPELLISLLRSYRTPHWPENLAKLIDGNMPDCYPERMASHAERPEWEDSDTAASGQLRRLDSERLGEHARTFPGLWKGADITAFRAVPPQYKVTAVAAARAGIVVSNLSTVLQDDLPREALYKPDESNNVFGQNSPTLSLVADTHGLTQFVLRHRLVSHHDLTPPFARGWNQGGPGDVCWWPDPDVTYNLLRRGKRGGDLLEEELAEIHLMGNESTDKPVIVRCRGSLWTAKTADDAVTVSRSGDGTLFVLCSSYLPNADGASAGLTRLHLTKDELKAGEDGQTPSLDQFIKAIKRFACVLEPVKRSFNLKWSEGSDDDCKRYIENYLKDCQSLREQLAKERFDAPAMEADCDAVLSKLQEWWSSHKAENELSEQFQRALSDGGALQEFRATARRFWPRLMKVPDGGLQLEPVGSTDEAWLVLWDLPSDSDVDSIRKIDHPLAQMDSRFWQVVAQRITGGSQELILRAVDGRAVMPQPGEEQGRNPGVTTTKVAWPKAVTEMITGGNQA